jgi:hypothetical protein
MNVESQQSLRIAYSAAAHATAASSRGVSHRATILSGHQAAPGACSAANGGFSRRRARSKLEGRLTMDQGAQHEFILIPEVTAISSQNWIKSTTSLFLLRRDKRTQVLDDPLENYAKHVKPYQTFCRQVRAELQSGTSAERSLALMQELERRFTRAKAAFEDLRKTFDGLETVKKVHQNAVAELDRQIGRIQFQFNSGTRVFGQAREARAQAFLWRLRAAPGAAAAAMTRAGAVVTLHG